MISEKTVKMEVMRLTVCIILKHFIFFHFHSSASFSALLLVYVFCAYAGNSLTAMALSFPSLLTIWF